MKNYMEDSMLRLLKSQTGLDFSNSGFMFTENETDCDNGYTMKVYTLRAVDKDTQKTTHMVIGSDSLMKIKNGTSEACMGQIAKIYDSELNEIDIHIPPLVWKTINNKENVGVSGDGSTLDVLYDSSKNGYMYLEIPIEFVIEAIKSRNDVQEG